MTSSTTSSLSAQHRDRSTLQATALTFKLLDTLALRRPQVLRRGGKLFLGHSGRTRVLRTARRDGQGRCQKSVYSCALAGDEFLHKEIVGIEKSDVHEYKFSVRSGDYKINFGKLSEMETKFKKLKAFYSKTFKDKTIKNYNLINLKYHNQVVCIK